jgi:hypothetical protein
MKEVKSRLKRDYKLANIEPLFQRNLTEAVLSGATVIEQVMIDNLTETAAYKMEYDQLQEYVLAGKREQLWNVVPPSIYSLEGTASFYRAPATKFEEQRLDGPGTVPEEIG